MSPKPVAPYLYTIVEAAEYLRTCERNVRDLVAKNEINYRRTGSSKRGKIVFLQSDLNELLKIVGGPGACGK